jgi:hypothetical protein
MEPARMDAALTVDEPAIGWGGHSTGREGFLRRSSCPERALRWPEFQTSVGGIVGSPVQGGADEVGCVIIRQDKIALRRIDVQTLGANRYPELARFAHNVAGGLLTKLGTYRRFSRA